MAVEPESDIFWQTQLREYFEVVEEDGKNVIVKCKQCLPVKKILSTARNSPANLLKHVEVSTHAQIISARCIYL